MLKKAVQQGRSKRRGESYSVPYVEPLSAARTPLADFFSILLELEQAVSSATRQHHVQPDLLLAVMKAESSFNPTVISKAGTVELMQLIPETAIRHGVRNLYDANENIAGGAKHLRYPPGSVPREHPVSLGSL